MGDEEQFLSRPWDFYKLNDNMRLGHSVQSGYRVLFTEQSCDDQSAVLSTVQADFVIAESSIAGIKLTKYFSFQTDKCRVSLMSVISKMSSV